MNIGLLFFLTIEIRVSLDGGAADRRTHARTLSSGRLANGRVWFLALSWEILNGGDGMWVIYNGPGGLGNTSSCLEGISAWFCGVPSFFVLFVIVFVLER